MILFFILAVKIEIFYYSNVFFLVVKRTTVVFSRNLYCFPLFDDNCLNMNFVMSILARFSFFLSFGWVFLQMFHKRWRVQAHVQQFRKALTKFEVSLKLTLTVNCCYSVFSIAN